MSAFLLTADLACSSRVAAAAQRTGVQVQTVFSVGALLDKLAANPAELIILDLTAPGLDPRDAVPRLRQQQPSAKLIAFGPHVHESKLAAAIEAGCDQVISRGQFHAQVDGLLASYLSRPPAE